MAEVFTVEEITTKEAVRLSNALADKMVKITYPSLATIVRRVEKFISLYLQLQFLVLNSNEGYSFCPVGTRFEILDIT